MVQAFDHRAAKVVKINPENLSIAQGNLTRAFYLGSTSADPRFLAAQPVVLCISEKINVDVPDCAVVNC